MAGRGQIIPSCDRFAERKKPNHVPIRDALSCNRFHDRSDLRPNRTPFGRCTRVHEQIEVSAFGVIASSSFWPPSPPRRGRVVLALAAGEKGWG